jgi:hypothetical protein
MSTVIFTESDQAGIPGTMYRFLDLVNVSPEFQYHKRQMCPCWGYNRGMWSWTWAAGLAMNSAGWPGANAAKLGTGP